MSASTGDWWHNAFDAIDRVVNGSDTGIQLYPDEIRDALAAVLPLFVAEATRRIEAQRAQEQRGMDGYAVGNATYNEGLRYALAAVAGLAGEVGQHD